MRYKLYDISAKGDKLDTGKVITISDVTANATADAVAEMFKQFGFTEYLNYYKARVDGESIIINTNFLTGLHDVWHLERIKEISE